MTDLAERTSTGRWATWRAPVRVLLWVALVGSVPFALWGTPRYSSQDDFARALKAGDVAAVSLADQGRYGLEAGPSGVTVAASPTSVVWESSDGRLHRTDLQPLSVGDPGSPGDATDLSRTIAATWRAAGHDAPLFDQGLGIAGRSATPLGLLTLAALFWIIAGPQPRRVTKWGMFWLLFIPLGVGLAWWLARDAPFVERLHRAAAPPPRARGDMPYGVGRVGGGTTVLVSIGASIALGLLLAVVLGLGSTSNGPSSPTEAWHLVPATQQDVTNP
jgi:hypothetical protein